jgi:hypothetical protein
MGFFRSILNALRFNRKNWKAIVLSILAAALFWLFNALNKTHSANIAFPLHFDYDQEKYQPIGPLPERIRLNVTGVGWELFWKSTGLKVAPLSIPLERPTETKKIVGSSLPPLFSTQIEGLQINYVLTDTLYVDIGYRVRRKVGLMVDSVHQYLARGFVQSGPITLVPDSIIVEGPDKIVHTLPEVLAIPLPVSNLRYTYSDMVEIPSPHESIGLMPSVVQINIPVAPSREITVQLPVVLQDVPSGYKPVLEIAALRCWLRIPETLTDTTWVQQVRALVRLQGLKRGEQKIIPVLEGLPPFVQVVKTDTPSVKF